MENRDPHGALISNTSKTNTQTAFSGKVRASEL